MIPLTTRKERQRTLMNWVGYWRKNPHRFCEEYLGIRLFLFQKVLLYMMNISPFFMYIAARGQGKSFLIGVYCVTRCILYPGTNIVIASGVKNQARLILSEKVMALYNSYQAVRDEIGDFKSNMRVNSNAPTILFQNGSKIEVATSNDNARGYRCNVLVLDEFRLLKQGIVKDVLKPMLNVVRTPAFKTRYPEKYKDYMEDNVEIYISSAWYKSHWSWEEFNEFLKKMLTKMKSHFAISIPYQVSLAHGLLDVKRIEEEKTSSMFDPNNFAMEYEGVFIGENANSFFKLEPLNACRVLQKAFIPPTHDEYLDNRRLTKPKNLSNIPIVPGEIRLVGLDVALVASHNNSKNDTSVLVGMRMIPDKDGSFKRDLVYIESIYGGSTTSELAVRFKRFFYDFNANYAIIDARGNGLGVYDACCTVLYDELRDRDYEPWISANTQQLIDRFKNNNGKPVLYTYLATNQLNDEIARGLRSAIQNGVLRLPINEIERRDMLLSEEGGKFVMSSPDEQNRQLYTYYQTTALVSELISLEYTMADSAMIKIKEVGNSTKDRYSALAYTNHRAHELELEMKRKEPTSSLQEFIPSFKWKRDKN